MICPQVQKGKKVIKATVVSNRKTWERSLTAQLAPSWGASSLTSKSKWKPTNWIFNCSPTGISGCSYIAGTAGFFVLYHMGVEDFKLTLATLLQEKHHLHTWRSTLRRRNFVKCFPVKALHFFPCHVFSVQCHAFEGKYAVKGKCMSSFTKN